MTALQELKLKTKEFLEINKENFNELPNSEIKEITELLIKTIFDKMLYSIDVLLEIEKQNIILAYQIGYKDAANDCYLGIEKSDVYKQGLEYFKQTFKENE